MITETRASYNGVRTRVLSVAGNGLPMVLMHGFADSADTWRGLLAEFEAAGRSAIAVDLPGFGAAGALAPGPRLPQLDAFADALIAEIGPCVLVGNSLGACTAVRAGGRGSSEIRGVVAVDEPVLASHLLARMARGRRDPFRLFTDRQCVPKVVHQRMVRAAFARLLYGDPKQADPEVVARFVDQVPDAAHMRVMLADARRYGLETASGYDLARFACPLLVVHGRKDRIIPVHAGVRLHQSVAGSTLIVMPESGHCPQIDDPAGLAAHVLRFLDSTLDGRNHQVG
ncbi:alpha/beta fold hydrolase [Nocardia sp. NBC_01327]|uniref:alpha/beta fold hydrolase n=1 Tax=Nocardia sp. NBC_01327 TaxID=2903593 RepID=UPI002E11D637|nr:alpha/beta hydrolase [Nocardia sp. NBC_01327]